MMVRCVNCIWLSDNKCTIKDIEIFAPNVPRRCIYYNLVPEVAKNYLSVMSEVTKNDIDEMSKSEPFKNYLKKMKLVRLS